MFTRPIKLTAKEGCTLADKAAGLPQLKAFCADEGYRGTLVEHVPNTLQKAVDITGGIKGAGFQVIPKRRIVERTFAWFGWWRRLTQGL